MTMIGSFSFRLTLIYIGLFVSSLLLLGFAHYWISIRYPLGIARGEVREEAAVLAAVYQRRGGVALASQLEARRRSHGDRMAFHALIAPDGKVVTTNLPSWPAWDGEGWHRIEADVFRDGDESDHEALTFDQRLGDGTRLLVGRDIEDIDDREEVLGETVAWLLGSAVLLGLVGGVLMSRAIGRRIDAVTRTARRVMDGDLSGRIPTRGGVDDFDRLAVTLNEMLGRIETLFESVRRISDNVAHELRTPLMRLRADLEALPNSADRPGLIEAAIAEATALERVFNAVLRIARIESGRHEAGFDQVELGALVRDAAELYEPAAEDGNQQIEITATEPVTIRGDRDLLFQSVCNLLDNAIKHAARGRRITLVVERSAAAAQLIVRDDGPGVPEAQRGRMSERFYRSASTRHAPGAGLGLSFVAAVAELHGSSLTFEDGRPGLLVRWVFR
jgi:signal transduction histidine kinase